MTKMNKILITITFLFNTVLVIAQAPTFEWTKNTGGYYGYCNGSSIIADNFGNVYTYGYFEGKVDFDPGLGNFYLTSIGIRNGFLSKKDSAGNLIWVKHFNGHSYGSMTLNSDGDIIIGGSFYGTVDFDPGPATFNLTSVGARDIFIVMLNGAGNFIWVRQLGGSDDDEANKIAIDASNNICVTGNFIGIVDFDPGAGNLNLGMIGSNDQIFILKLNSAGNLVFAKNMPGGISVGISIAVDPAGNIYTTGYFSNTVDFDPGINTYNLMSSGISIDVFISKLNTNGDFIWAKRIGGTQSDIVNSIITDNSGNVSTVGTFMGTSDFDPGPGVNNLTSTGTIDIFISKLDSSGNYIYANRLGGSNNSEKVNSLSLDGVGNIYMSGKFSGTIDFDPGTGNYNVFAPYYAGFTLKLGASGTFIWVKTFECSDSNISGNSISFDLAGNIYSTGCFKKVCDFDPGPGIYNLIAPGEFFMFTSKLDSSGNFLWASSTGTGSSILTKSMITDLAGNVYTTGYFYGIVDFDPGPGVNTLSTALTDIKGDIFIMKCNSSGNILWVKQIGGLEYDYSTVITIDAIGNVYTFGRFNGTVDFNPGPGIYNLIASPTAKNFVSKLNTSGNFVWAKILNSNSSVDIHAVATDQNGNLYTAGKLFSNSYEIHLCKINSAGNVLWTKVYGGPSEDYANAITTDISGNIYITGNFNGTVDFDPGNGINNLSAPSSNYEVFISKLDGAGNFLWAKQIGGTSYEMSYDISLDAAGNIYFAGEFNQTSDFDPGTGIYNLTSVGINDAFICKLDNTGNFIWAKQIAGNDFKKINSIAVDNFGSVYSTGVFGSTADFDPGSGIFNLNSYGNADDFILKLDSSGNFKWVQQIGNSNYDQVYSISLDVAANIYTAGTFYQTIDFDPGSGISNLTATGYPDMFIQKLSQCLAPIVSITSSGPTTFCVGGSVTLNANTGTGLTFQWKRNGVSIAGATSSSYIATTSGNYSVFVSDSQPCTAVSGNIHVSVPCVPIGPNYERAITFDKSETQSFQISPNPGTGVFLIQSPPGQLQVFNSLGEIILSIEIFEDKSKFDISEYSDGIYFVTLNTSETIYSKKIVLSH